MASSDSHQISDTTLKAQWQTLLSTIESHIKTFHSTTTLTPTLTNTPQLTPTLAGYFDDYSHLWLHQSQPTAPVLQKLLITWLHAAVFAKYIFGMSSAWNSQMGIISAAVAPEGTSHSSSCCLH